MRDEANSTAEAARLAQIKASSQAEAFKEAEAKSSNGSRYRGK